MVKCVLMETTTLEMTGLYDVGDFYSGSDVAIAEEDSRGISARSTKNGTRPLHIVTMTREMDS